MDRIDSAPQTSEAAARLDRLFRLHNARLAPVAVRYTRSAADAEDVLGETWLRATASISALRTTDERAFGWLRSILTRAASDHYRTRRAAEVPSDWSDPATEARLPLGPFDPVPAEALALADLTAHQAAVIRLAAAGLSDRRIARRLGRAENAVWKRRHAGARRLRASLGVAA